MATFTPGDWVTWLHKERGGHGYAIPVQAQVIRATTKHVHIRVLRLDGTWAERSVRHERLRARQGDGHEPSPVL